MKACLLASAAVFLFVPAHAADWTVNPWMTQFNSLNVTVGGEAYGALFSADMPKSAGFSQHWATGAADLHLKVVRYFDTGLMLGVKSSFEVANDRLSRDNYGGNFVSRVYGVAQTGLGNVELGMTDGAAYVLSVTGPVVDPAVSIDNANETFFLNPATGHAFTQMFGLNSSVESSLNYAKISYYTPRLLGLQIGVSYTPSEGREVLPFLNNGPHHENRQKSIWETAISYSQVYGRTAIGFYGAVALGHGDGKASGDAGLTDWGLGAEIDYNLTDDLKLAFGGGYRHANTFAFDIYDARTTGGTESGHLSTTLTWGPWIIGGEYGSGTADGGTTGPVLGVRAWQSSLGYVINRNLQVTVGWQQMHYHRNSGAFYNGAPRVEMNAAFLHLKMHV